MPDTDEAPALKRKASLSPPADDGASKRAKTDFGRGDAQSEEGNNADSGDKRRYSNDAGPPLKQESPDERSNEQQANWNADTTSPRRRTDGDAAARLSSEAKRAAPPTAKRDFSQEEKKRGKRLFGGLLNTLSQTTSNTQQRKRLEIERRQHERAQQQRAEDDSRRVDKLNKLIHTRKVQQIKLDEEVMNARHSNMLSCARSLETRSEPKLYYRPWELTRSQERIIDEQISKARETISREREEFEHLKEKRLRELGERPPSRSQPTVGEPKSTERTNRRESASSVSKEQADKDDAGEMVHDAEDTVLY